MKLSELVHYLNLLERFSIEPVESVARPSLNDIVHMVQSHQFQLDTVSDTIGLRRDNVMQAIQNFDNYVTDLKKTLRDKITELEPALFQQSYQWYEEQNNMLRGFNNQTDTYRDDYGIIRQGKDKNVEATRDAILVAMLKRLPKISAEAQELQTARIRRTADWRYPAMIIHPGNNDLIDHMVPNDPLYIIDEHRQLLQPTMDRYPDGYQRRLRPYVIQEIPNQPILKDIPNDQFIVCVAYNFFDYKPLEVIRQYLTEIYTKLRPGGTVVMTFNDCDRGCAVESVERDFACYTPGYLIRSLAETIGYQKHFEFNIGDPWTWIEFRKPGTISTIRAGQTMAKILPN